MALDYDQARRHAQGWVDAFNRRDLDAVEAMQHQEMTHQSQLVDRYLSQQQGRIDSRQAHRELLRWLWAMEPPFRLVLDEVFTGPHGYACLISENDGIRVVFVREVDADGLIRAQRAYEAPPPEG
jgi:hypothetical protein